MDRFLAEAKTGNLTPERTKNYVEGNIKQYDMLGSQNAIASLGLTQNETTLIKDITKAIQTTLKLPDKPDKPLLGQTRKVLPVSPGTPTEPEVKPNPKAKEPNSKPPFDVLTPGGLQEYKVYAKYLVEKYGERYVQKDIDDMYNESGAFSLAIKTIRKLEQAIVKFENNPSAKFAQWLNNTVSDLLGTILSTITDTLKNALKGVIAFGTGGTGLVGGEIVGAGVDEVKKIINNMASFRSDIVGNLRYTIDQLFEIGDRKSAWRRKYAEMKAEWQKIDEKNEQLSKESKDFLDSPEGKEWQQWQKDHPSGKDAQKNGKKLEELKKKYKERLEKVKKGQEEMQAMTGETLI